MNRSIRLGVLSGLSLIAVIVLAGCADDDSSNNADLAAFCDAIERSEDSNPFGIGSREPDLGLFLVGLADVSAAYKDALAHTPREISEEFSAFASEAIERYDSALAIEDPTDLAVDAVIFGGTGEGASDELLEFIRTECDIDL
jgi:hypothetical protein